MPKAGQVSHATNTATDVRILPWKASHIAAADAAAKAVFELLAPVIADEDDTATSATVASALEPCGSYLLRTSLNAAPETVTSGAHSAVGCPLVYPVDVTLTLTEEFCSMQAVDEGRYLTLRQDALNRVRKVLDKAHEGGFRTNDTHGKKAGTSNRAELVAVRSVPLRQHPMLASSKSAVVARFELSPVDVAEDADDDEEAATKGGRRRGNKKQHHAHKPGAQSSKTRRVFFDVTLHTRPAKVSSKVSASKAVSKMSSAWYANLVLEDHYAPQHLEKLHALVSANHELSRAIVLGKLWARHVAALAPPTAALPAASNGAAASAALAFTASSSQGVSGFVLTAILAGHAAGNASGSAAASTSDAFLRLMWMSLSGLTLSVPAPGSNLNTMHIATATVPSADQLDIRRTAAQALKTPKGLSGILAQPHPTHAAELFDAVVTLRPAAGSAFVEKVVVSAAEAAHVAEIAEEKRFPQYPAGRAVAAAVYATLEKALSERVSALRVSADESGSVVSVAVSYKTEADARNRLFRGAPIEERKLVDRFNELWGPALTSSRQFADGGVFRCLVWPSELSLPGNAESLDVRGAAALTTQLVAHLVGRHHVRLPEGAQAPASADEQRMAGRLTVPANLTADLLDICAEPHDATGALWTDAMPLAAVAARSTFDRVSQLVTKVSDKFPCVIKSIDAVSDNVRATCPFALLPSNAILGLSSAPSKDVQNLVDRKLISLRAAVDPIHAVIVIDDKNKIPDSLDAIGTMKGAIAAQLAKALISAVSDDVRVLCAKSSVDVVVDGYVVRLHIGHYREISLLNALERPAEAMAIERRLFRSGQHSRYIDGVIGTHISARGAMRLLKRWIGAACLSDYVLPEALELLVASIYTRATWDDALIGSNDRKAKDAPDEVGSSSATTAPRSAGSGFLRCLRLLADAPALMARPIVLSDAPSDVRRATLAFKKVKEDNPEQALFIAAPYALEESPYTFNTPRGAMVERVAQVAAAALRRFAEACGATMVAAGSSAALGAPGSAIAAVFDVLDCHSFDAVLPFTDRVRAIAGTASRAATVQAGPAPMRLGHPWAATKAERLSNADLGRRIAPLIEREPAAAAVRTLRGAVRDEALLFYDTYAPSAVGITLLRKRNVSFPIEWEQTHGASVGSIPPPPMDGAFCDTVPHALPETAGCIKRAIAAAPGLIAPPHLLKQIRPEPSADGTGTTKKGKKNKGPGKQPREETAEAAEERPAEEEKKEAAATPAAKKHRNEPAGEAASTATPAKGKKTPAKRAAEAPAAATTPAAAPKVPDATPAKKDATPAKKDATPAKKDATPAKKDATPVKPQTPTPSAKKKAAAQASPATTGKKKSQKK